MSSATAVLSQAKYSLFPSINEASSDRLKSTIPLVQHVALPLPQADRDDERQQTAEPVRQCFSSPAQAKDYTACYAGSLATSADAAVANAVPQLAVELQPSATPNHLTSLSEAQRIDCHDGTNTDEERAKFDNEDDGSLYENPRPLSDSATLVGSRTSSVPSILSSLAGAGRQKAPPSSLVPQHAGAGQIAIRSMFPTYDDERRLAEQYYLPSQMSPTHLPYNAVCKSPYKSEFGSSQQPSAQKVVVDEVSGLVFKAVGGSEGKLTIPPHDEPDFWSGVSGGNDSAARQFYRLLLHREPSLSSSTSRWGRRRVVPRKDKKRKDEEPRQILTLGHSPDAPVLSVEQAPGRLLLWRHTLSRFTPQPGIFAGSRTLLADCRMERPVTIDGGDGAKEGTAIIDAAHPLHQIHPGGDGAPEVVASFTPHAAQPNFDASATIATLPAEDSCPPTCELLYTSIDGPGRQRGYVLRHDTVGQMRIKITGDVRLRSEPTEKAAKGKGSKEHAAQQRHQPLQFRVAPCPQGRIELLAPLADKLGDETDMTKGKTLGAREPEIALASLDLATAELALDGAALPDLRAREPCVAEVALASLVAVLAAETQTARVSRALAFAPPPGRAFTDDDTAAARRRRRATRLFRPFSAATVPTVQDDDLYAALEGDDREVGPKQTRRRRKPGRRERAGAEVEATLSTAFGVLAVVLGMAVDSLASAVERKQQQLEHEQPHDQQHQYHDRHFFPNGSTSAYASPRLGG